MKFSELEVGDKFFVDDNSDDLTPDFVKIPSVTIDIQEAEIYRFHKNKPVLCSNRMANAICSYKEGVAGKFFYFGNERKIVKSF